MRPRILVAPLAAITLALALTGCGGSDSEDDSSAATDAAKVEIVEFLYQPEAVTVSAGGSVTFANSDSDDHTATADDREAFDTGVIRKGQSKEVSFEKPGTFAYFCDFHPFMTGEVEVVE